MSGELKNTVFYILRISENVDEKGKPVPFSTWPSQHHRGAMKLIGKIMSTAKFQWQKKKSTPEEPEEFIWLLDSEKAPEGYTKSGSYELGESDVEITETELEALRYLYKKRESLPEMSEKTIDELTALIA